MHRPRKVEAAELSVLQRVTVKSSALVLIVACYRSRIVNAAGLRKHRFGRFHDGPRSMGVAYRVRISGCIDVRSYGVIVGIDAVGAYVDTAGNPHAVRY